MEAARHEAAELVRRTKEELRQIRQAASSQQTLDRARSQLQQLEQQIVAQMQQHPPSAGSSQPIEVGDVVELLQTQQRGRVVEITPKHLLVEVGSVRLRVEPHAVRRTERVPDEHMSGTVRPLKLDAPTEIDVRGMRARDAVAVIERALNDAVLGGVLRLTIIHGTGTGQLREAIHAYLEQHPLVASYRVGQAGSTDWGRTYVELR
jgi:DNA mismatch repair protein MutS2